MMILHRYLARRFLRALGIVTAVFVAILVPIRLADELGEVEAADRPLAAAFELTLLSLPSGLYEILPLFVMLATLVLFLGLSRTSELVVIRAAGRSAFRSSLSPILVAFMLGVAAVAVLNPIVAATEQEYARAKADFSGREARTLSIGPDGLWLRQGSEARQTVIHAYGTNANGTELDRATFHVFGPNGQVEMRIAAETARLTQGAWVLTDAKLWPIGTSDNPEADAELHAEYSLPSSLTPEQIRDSFGRPQTISIYELPGFIADLDRAGFAALTHRVWLQMELSNPLMLAAMVLIGAGFTMRHTRFGRTGVAVLAAILLGFSVFFIRNFAKVLGESGQLPIVVVAWTPPLAAILLALALLLYTEDG